ncbi:hypothetical protein [Sphingomonas sp. CGMCC 1.13658]|uniref:hypothetical protein n=1 Tax=Sphingomonas sp. CGMCC 1.13658 TaxID=2755554 RepID=UPI0012ECD97D|nr:hypothetical protein [Sphingomonas sp. CGMCC 1.13658]MBA2918951.1 hypothetical protein [Sphingomonas sp. CGMCC 1.13658]
MSCASAPLHANISSFDTDCWQSSELDALKVQRFKTMLLVAMLNCRDLEPGIVVDSNRFVRANRALIAEKQAIVRAHFVRTRGALAGLDAYSEYETALGNQYSDADFTPDRCADAAADLRDAGYVSERGLTDMIRSVPDEGDALLCPPERRYAERPATYAPPPPLMMPRADPSPPPLAAQAEPVLPPAPVAAAPEPAPQAADEMAQTEWPDLAPVQPEGPARAVDPNAVKLAEAPPPPAAMPAKPAEPVQVAAVDAPKPAVAPDRMKAVRDAARALREALAALEAEGAESGK